MHQRIETAAATATPHIPVSTADEPVSTATATSRSSVNVALDSTPPTASDQEARSGRQVGVN